MAEQTTFVAGEVDAVWIPALRQFATLRHLTVEQAVGVLVRQGLAKGAQSLDAARCECERCVNERERDARRRRRNGQPERVPVAPLKSAPTVPWIPKGIEQTCPVCDATYEQRPGKGRKQEFCSRPCMKYNQRYGIKKARAMFALAKQREALKG